MKWLEEDLSGARIHEKLREEGEKVFVRMHALPGEEGQVNFGYLRLLYYAMKARKEKSESLNNITTHIFEDKTISDPIFIFAFMLAYILCVFYSIYRTRVKNHNSKFKTAKNLPVCRSPGLSVDISYPVTQFTRKWRNI